MNKGTAIVIVLIVATFGTLILLWFFSNKFRLWLRYLGHTGQTLRIGTMTNYPNMDEINLADTNQGTIGFAYLQSDKPYYLSADAWKGLETLDVQKIADNIEGSVEYMEVSWNKTALGQIADLYVRGTVQTEKSADYIISKIKDSSAKAALDETNAWGQFRAFRLS
jgi:50S ribosomal subunit-associated GTPase HflX